MISCIIIFVATLLFDLTICVNIHVVVAMLLFTLVHTNQY